MTANAFLSFVIPTAGSYNDIVDYYMSWPYLKEKNSVLFRWLTPTHFVVIIFSRLQRFCLFSLSSNATPSVDACFKVTCSLVAIHAVPLVNGHPVCKVVFLKNTTLYRRISSNWFATALVCIKWHRWSCRESAKCMFFRRGVGVFVVLSWWTVCTFKKYFALAFVSRTMTILTK